MRINLSSRVGRIPLADWLPHLPPEFEYFCLQKIYARQTGWRADSSRLIVRSMTICRTLPPPRRCASAWIS